MYMSDLTEVSTERSGRERATRLLVLSAAVAVVYGGSGIYETVHWRSMSGQFVAWGYRPTGRW